jgi:antitoxin component YwqK of YwqJK toxin-antitoxin module
MEILLTEWYQQDHINLKNMKNILVITFAVLLFSCDSKINYINKEYYIKDSFKVSGRFINDTIKDGVFFTYYPTGEMSSIEVYENGVPKKDLFFYFHKNRKIETYRIKDITSAKDITSSKYVSQYVFDERGDTVAYFFPNRSLYFYQRNLFKKIEFKNGVLSFDSLGNVIDFKGKLNTINREDSLTIANDYPDFVKEIVFYVNKKKSSGI